jgi:hypothetical protein
VRNRSPRPVPRCPPHGRRGRSLICRRRQTPGLFLPSPPPPTALPGKAWALAAGGPSSSAHVGASVGREAMAGGELGERRAGAASAARRSHSGGLAAVVLVVGGSMEAVALRWTTGGEGLTLARVSGDIVGMAEMASRRNKGVGARSPSRQGHLWPRW